MSIVYFSDPPSNPFAQRAWLVEFKNYVLYGTLPGSGGSSSVPANYVNAGPTSGGSTNPTFRALVAADIPSLDASKIGSGTIATARIPGLDAAKITSGVLGTARIPFASPGAIGGTTPGSGAFTTLSTTGNATVGGNLTVVGSLTFDLTDIETSHILIDGTTHVSTDGYQEIGAAANRYAGIKLLTTADGGATWKKRWFIHKNGAETGSQAGSSLYLGFWNDAEDTQITMITMRRNTNEIDMTTTTTVKLPITSITGDLTGTGNATFANNLQSKYGKVQNSSGAAYQDIAATSGSVAKSLRYYTGANRRWEITTFNNETGIGSALGSDLYFIGYADNGTTAYNYMSFLRASAARKITMYEDLNIQADLDVDADTIINGSLQVDGAVTFTNSSGYLNSSAQAGLFRVVGAHDDYNPPGLTTDVFITNATGTPGNTTTHHGYWKIYMYGVASYIRYYR